MNQAVCVSFDPPLVVDGCSVWQLLRPTSEQQRDSSYTLQMTQNAVNESGFILVAMNDDGTPFRGSAISQQDRGSGSELFCVAPSLTFDCVGKPLAKESIELIPFKSTEAAVSSSSSSSYFTWKVQRFPGGGICFGTTLERVRDWKANVLTARGQVQQAEEQKKPQIKDSNVHYLSDEPQLLSTKHTGGNAAGFGMLLRFPPVVDVTPFLDFDNNDSGSGDALSAEAIATTQRFLIDAACDCGFFFAVVNGGTSKRGFAVKSQFVSSSDALDASRRLLAIARCNFGRCIAHQDNDNGDEEEEGTNDATEKLPRQLTKVTLKSSTGLVKTSFNPPRFSPIQVPEWLAPLGGGGGDEIFNNFIGEHQAMFHCSKKDENQKQQAAENQATTVISDLDAYFHFGEELAARMIASLLRGVGTEKDVIRPDETEWPGARLKALQPSVRDIVPTQITAAAAATSTTTEASTTIPRVPVEQLYSLFRAVCYPPSRKGFDDDDADETDDDDEGEEAEEASSSSSSSSSHRSSNTDDSEGKALYEHTDKTWITLLTAAPSLKGLQVVDCDGSTFRDVRVPAPYCNNAAAEQASREQSLCFICNIGDALQMVSRGGYISRTHRARNPKSCSAAAATTENDEEGEQQHNGKERCCCEFCRVSLPLFVEPSPERWPVAYVAENVVMMAL